MEINKTLICDFKMSNQVRLFELNQKDRNKLINFKLWIAAICLLFYLSGFISTALFAQPLAKNKSIFLGNIIGSTIHSNFSKYWNQVTAENAGKWGSVEYSQGSYNWTQLDNIYNYAISNGFLYKHHNLIWGNQQPSFLSSLDSAQQYQEIVNWIDTTGKRYPNADFCDVVNEPLPGHNPPDGGGTPARANYKNALGGDGKTGWDWVVNAFKLARKYWPNTKLLINDYGILNSSSNTNAYIQIINILKDSSLIDGIGCQAHGFESISAAAIKSNLDKLAATGLPIYISEFDLNIQDDAQQKAKYQELFPVMWEHPAVKGITLWGYIENETWKPYLYLIDYTGRERPAMEWLRSYMSAPSKPTVLFPVDTTGVQRNPILKWSASDSATSYKVQVSSSGRFNSFIIDSTVTDTILQLDSLNSNTIYYWRVNASNDKGTSSYSDAASFTTGNQIVGVKDNKRIPSEFLLEQNYPNPFNPSTKINYSIPQAGYITLKIYNVLGKEVEIIFAGHQKAGNHLATFNAINLPSGVYFYRLSSDKYSETKKLILLK
jgi:endo-1,4-beta-xylanase